MRLRDRLADMISSDEKTRRKCARQCIDILANELGEAKFALREIAAMETPRANATVRRMAQVAKEALK